MNLTDSPTDAAFRAELREWLQDHDAGPQPDDREAWFSWRRDWQRTLADGGWCGVHWPVKYGGRGATPTQSAIFFEELAHSGSPLPANSLGLLLAGPTIMAWGTEEQKERLLPPILSGEDIWCQGFSEPDAGSDLASLRTRATQEDGDWLITGQKVWTSHAAHSRRCALLARTSTEEKRHQGLSFFLMNVDQPGVQVQPLREMTGDAHFNELFIDDARVEAHDVLGPVGQGWKVAMTMLMNERSGLAFFWQVRLRQLLDKLIDEARQRGLTAQPGIAERLGALEVRVECLRMIGCAGLARLERDGQPGPEGSLAKLIWSRANQELPQLAVDILGPYALASDSEWAYELLRARGNTIEGGTTEILKNIVAERVLGLPKAR
jgi:alkylation response protein AidB-like acyl-CoA dehydrogenase